MKKCYTLILLCILSVTAISQQRFWVGPSSGAGGNWNSTANWSATSGGVSGASVPNGASFDVVFDQNAVVNVDLGAITLNTLKVTNSRTSILYTTIPTNITLNSSSAAAPGLDVDATSTLKDSIAAQVNFTITFAPGARGEVDGDWILAANPGIPADSEGSNFDASAASVLLNFNATGRLLVNYNGYFIGTAATTHFRNGSFLTFNRNGGIAGNVDYEANSTIRITGNTTQGTSINGFPASIGNLEYDSPTLNPVAFVSLGINNGSTIKGNLRILNTNNRRLSLAFAPVSTINVTILGNLEISGTSYLMIADQLATYNIAVNGNFIQSGGTFSLQDNHTTSNPTTLILRGNLTQTGGTFTANSIATNSSTNYFIVEMNGAGAQTISMSSGSIDNTLNQVALRLNNPSGVTLLTPLATGRLHFVSGNINTTNTNLLTVNNNDNSLFVTNGASASSYVSGPVKRRTNIAGVAYRFPVGKNGIYHYVEVMPETAAVSEYIAEYFDVAYPDLSVATPLTGVSNDEYWIISRVLGSNAKIVLTLNGTAVPGAGLNDAVVVGQYNGADWINVKGATGTQITPGNSTTGTVSSDNLAGFNNPFTFAFLPTGALPIKLRTFDAVKAAGYNLLNWRADCYSTQAIFELERSTDGQRFSIIETVVASQQRCQSPFDYKDFNAGQGTVYYRIKVIDVDGKAYYSRVIALVSANKGFEIIGVYPSVISTGDLKVNIAAAKGARTEFYISNSLGQILRKFPVTVVAGENLIPVFVGDLSAGTYQITGFTSDGVPKSFRFIKQ